MIKVAHIADLHCCREHQEEALKSLHFLAQSIKKSPVDLVAIAGDTWDASMLNTETSGFNGFVDAIRDIADEAPVAMIYGTPSRRLAGGVPQNQLWTFYHGSGTGAIIPFVKRRCSS